MNFQDIILTLDRYWGNQGCIIQHPHHTEVGAGTMNPATFFRALGPELWNVGYVEPSIRPTDGRYGENPNRWHRFYQYQVILKPSPDNVQELYLKSLEALGIKPLEHDIRFVEDDWESPSLGAWGVGWEVWLDGMEITQFTYFQQVGGFECRPVAAEITYGLERIAMFLQGVDTFLQIKWNDLVTYGDVHLQEEIEFCHYNFNESNPEMLFNLFSTYEKEASALLDKTAILVKSCRELDKEKKMEENQGRLKEILQEEQRLLKLFLTWPAYDYVLKCSHTLNLLEARGALSVTERTNLLLATRALAKRCAEYYILERRLMGHPLLRNLNNSGDLKDSCMTKELVTSGTPGTSKRGIRS